MSRLTAKEYFGEDWDDTEYPQFFADVPERSDWITASLNLILNDLDDEARAKTLALLDTQNEPPQVLMGLLCQTIPYVMTFQFGNHTVIKEPQQHYARSLHTQMLSLIAAHVRTDVLRPRVPKEQVEDSMTAEGGEKPTAEAPAAGDSEGDNKGDRQEGNGQSFFSEVPDGSNWIDVCLNAIFRHLGKDEGELARTWLGTRYDPDDELIGLVCLSMPLVALYYFGSGETRSFRQLGYAQNTHGHLLYRMSEHLRIGPKPFLLEETAIFRL